MESKNQAKERIHSLFQLPENRENLDLLSKFLSQPSKGLCLCKVMPEERVKILSFFDDDPWNGRIHIIDMVNPPLGPMDLQQVIININNRPNTKKDIFFIYNIEGCIRLLQTTADEYFQRMNLIRDFFIQFETEFVFFITEALVNTMIQNAFDFYDWMKVTFTFTPEFKEDSLRQGIKPGEKETIEYSNPLDKIKYLEKSIERVKNENARAIQQLELGELYLQVGDYEKALEIFNKALKVFEKTNDRGNMEKVRANMDRVNRINKDKTAGSDRIIHTWAMDEDQFNWVELLNGIHLKEVIPVIGHGLYWMEVESEDKLVSLYDYLAERVLELWGYGSIPGENHRFAKACLIFLERTGNDYLKLSQFLQESLNKLLLFPAGSLWKLARIKAFHIFITTAYDNFLANVIKSVRETPMEAHYYSAWEKYKNQLNIDLLDGIRESKYTLVYHLFGNMKMTMAPAYKENDIMETLLEFHKDMVIQPETNLFRKLKASNLLFMGCGFDDWLYRFFIRIISDKSYTSAGLGNIYKWGCNDFRNYKRAPLKKVSRFLRDDDSGGFYAHSPSEFVDILFDKLSEYYPEEIIQPSDYPVTVFISFAGSDRAEARRLASHLREDGINVWLDEVILKPGDKIGEITIKAIEKCAVFIPLISENSRQVMTDYGKLKYHIREWEWASSRQVNGINKIIIPVKIDNTDWMYDLFRKYAFVKTPGGHRKRDYEKLKDRLLEVQRNFRR